MNITIEGLLDYDPDVEDDLYTIQKCLRVDCKAMALDKYPHLKIEDVNVNWDRDNASFTFRILQNVGLGRVFRSVGNDLTAIKTTNDVKKIFKKFIGDIDRQYYVH
jgi:hypothetical protein